MQKIRRTYCILLLAGLLSSASAQRCLTLPEAVDVLALKTPEAQAARLRYQNELLTFANYQKSFLPIVQVGFSPLSFNRSMRLLQDPYTGNYSNVEDFSNTSSADISIQQRVGPTGGTFTASSSLSFLREFSVNSNSFSSTPFYLSYSQPLRGGYRQYKFTRALSRLQRDLAAKSCATVLSGVQQSVLSLYLAAFLARLQRDLEGRNVQMGDTLLELAALKRTHGYITNYDYNQVELQQLGNRSNYQHAVQSYHNALTQLQAKLGMVADSLELAAPDMSVLPSVLDENEVLAYIRQNNPQSLSDELQRTQAAYTRHSTRMATQFNGTVSVSYGANQYAETFRAAYTRPNQRQAVAVSFSIPAFDWGVGRNKRRMAENEYAATLLDLDVSRQEFENTVRTQITAYNYASGTYRLTERGYQLAQEQYRLAVERFALGRASVYELTSAGQSQYTAMQQYYSAVQSLFAGYYTLRGLALRDFVKNQNLEEMVTNGTNLPEK